MTRVFCLTITLKKRIARELVKLIPDAKIELETTRTGRIGGFIISDAFADKSQIERQDWVWDYLEDVLGKENLTSVVSLLTLTPMEVEEVDAAG